MSTIQVDDDIPIPPKKSGYPSMYPIRELQPGQSFFAPEADIEATHKLVRYFLRYAGRAKIGITTRIRTEDGVHGVRVWREV